MSEPSTQDENDTTHFWKVRPLDPDILHHPAVVTQFEKRASDAQLRVADKITAFAAR